MTKRRLVVVGNGMAGARFVEDLVAARGTERFAISVYGDEPHGNYNRVLLSGVLAGEHAASDIFLNPTEWYAAHGVALHVGSRIGDIDLAAHTVHAENGEAAAFDDLVLATGSAPLLPPIHGLMCADRRLSPGVFLFRTLDDCRRIVERASACRTAAVIGGGLLGLEAAKGLVSRGLDVHVIHLRSSLMDAQLDADGAAVLRRQLTRMGITIRVGTTTTAILTGDEHVKGLVFNDGSFLACDMVVVAAGIRPNIDLAARAGLTVNRGILVSDELACADTPDVYAIGECAEHRGEVYGLVGPVWEQARVLAARLSGTDPAARYDGSRTGTKLKVAGVDVSTIGVKDAVEDDDEVVSYAEPSKGVYKKLIVRGDRVAGAIVIGDGAIVPSLRQAFEDDTPLAGVRGELLFAASDRQAAPIDASLMPDTTRVCDCNAVTKAAIVEAVLAGARSVGAVSERTRACTGCGSCRPEVERIIALACEAAVAPEVLAHALPEAPAARPPLPRDASLVPQNKIERLKSEKDGLEILPEIPQLAGQPWQAIAEPDRERLKWAGVFFRKQTPGQFMMRVRIPNGLTNAVQIRALAGIAAEFGPGFLDITTRQQVQLRGFGIERVPEIWRRLEETGLGSLQTGMDNVRNVIGCALAGLDAHELLDASPVVREFTEMIVGNREFSNLPRKFNVGISGCRHHCTHAETQDLALTPAIAAAGGTKTAGFNVAVGGKMGSGGYRIATPLDVFVRPEDAAALCTAVTSIFRDYGSRAVRTRARLAFLIEEWGAAGFREELARRLGRPLEAAGEDARTLKSSDHLGVSAQKQPGLNAVGLAVPVGRVAAAQLTELARLADDYGSGDIRITTSQNVIIVNVPAERVRPLLAEPLLGVLSADPHGAVRGLVSCTGIDYCHFALIETKELAVKTAQHLAHSLPHGKRLTMHWSGCPAGCGNHAAADIGLLGKNVRIDGKTVDAVDVFVGGKAGPSAKAGVKVLEDVPCSDLPRVLEQVIPYLTGRRLATHADAPIPFPARVVAAPRDAASQSSRADT